MKISLILLIFYLAYGFKINLFEPIIGNWRLLYTNGKYSKDNRLSLKIIPINNDLNNVNVDIKHCENNNILIFTKIINCNLKDHDCNNIEDIDNCDIPIKDGESCCLIIKKTEKYIKSIGVFEFPYFNINYHSSMNKKYTVIWKINHLLGRLYIYFDNDTYIFEKKYYDKMDLNNDRITTNFFLITNFISFILGKLLEKTIHLN